MDMNNRKSPTQQSGGGGRKAGHRFGHTTHPQVTFADKNFMILEENAIGNL